MSTRTPWERAGWMEETGAWIRAAVAGLGGEMRGPISQPHVRPWSTVLLVPTGEGDLFFKASSPALAHETALTLALSHRYPELVLPVLAADPARGWMLLPDGGRRLRAVLQERREPRRWLELLPRYAELQIDAARDRDSLLSQHVPDRRPARLPEVYKAFLTSERALGSGTPFALSADEISRLHLLRSRFAALCAQLESGPIPATIQHDDLHDGNVFVERERCFIFDWGDASIAHPFLSLRVALRSVAHGLELTEDDRAVTSFRDAYLEPWTRFAPQGALVETLAATRPVGAIARMLAWDLALAGVDDLGDHAEVLPSLLREFLEMTSK